MNYIKILGASGSKTSIAGTTSFLIFKDILIDAGNVINTLGEESQNINHIFITHSHSDHILDLPFIIESYFEKRETPLTIYASKETIHSLKEHTFNNEIWPDFSQINILNSDKKSLIFVEIELHKPVEIYDYEITAIEANHIPGSFGYKVIKDNIGYVISGDTYIENNFIEEINRDKRVKSLVVECSFPSNLKQLAFASKHLTPELLKDELLKLKRDDIQVFIYHLKPSYKKTMVEEIKELDILKSNGKILQDGDVIHMDTGSIETNTIDHNKFERIMDINLELSSQRDKNKLFEMILTLTRELTNCEAGTLYILSEDNKKLEFQVVQNDPLNIQMNNLNGEITWKPLCLYTEDEKENKSMVAVVSALENKIVNIPDVYENSDYEFSGTKEFDKMTGYRSKSMLVIPLINHENEVIGVLQLINKTKVGGRVTNFTQVDEKILKALASQAAMALTNTQLIINLENFLYAFVETIGRAIDAKSPHTKNHIGKVSKLATLIAKAIHTDTTIYKDIKYTENDFKEIYLAAHMHDIGKISIPETIIDKSKKLDKLIDGVELIQQKAEILKRDFEIAYLKNEISKDKYEKELTKLEDNLRFIEETNVGVEYMDDSKIERIKEIASYKYKFRSEDVSFLTKDEAKNLSIRKGTLTDEEKDIMNSHAKLSLDMLSSLPFPKKYSNVFHIAVNHHEKLNGKGYPRGLTEKELVLEDKIMILADIFEALTASDRPYKKGKKLSEAFKILSFMAKDNEIDKELLEFFHQHKVLFEYANSELKEFQLDESKIDI